MFSTKFVVALVSSIAAISAVNANGTGWGKHWDPQGQTSCGRICPLTPKAVALPRGMFPEGTCCHKVAIAYNGQNIEATFTEVYETGAFSQNITMTDETFKQLAPLSKPEIFPVVWNIN